MVHMKVFYIYRGCYYLVEQENYQFLERFGSSLYRKDPEGIKACKRVRSYEGRLLFRRSKIQ